MYCQNQKQKMKLYQSLMADIEKSMNDSIKAHTFENFANGMYFVAQTAQQLSLSFFDVVAEVAPGKNVKATAILLKSAVRAAEPLSAMALGVDTKEKNIQKLQKIGLGTAKNILNATVPEKLTKMQKIGYASTKHITESVSNISELKKSKNVSQTIRHTTNSTMTSLAYSLSLGNKQQQRIGNKIGVLKTIYNTLYTMNENLQELQKNSQESTDRLNVKMKNNQATLRMLVQRLKKASAEYIQCINDVKNTSAPEIHLG